MVVRVAVLLLLANAGWLAWSQGWLRDLGLGPQRQAEPERIARQIHAEALRVQPLPEGADLYPPPPPEPPPAPEQDAASASVVVAEAPASVPAALPAPPAAPEPKPPAPAPTVCLQTGTFDEREAAAVRQAAARLPEGSWRLEGSQLPGRWMVYLGKFPDAIAVRVRRSELRSLGVDTDAPGAALEPGISLGRFSSEEAAQRGLAQVTRQGVQGARVVQERRDSAVYTLRLPKADAALRSQAQRQLRTVVGGREWRECG